jgi:hypothetical protein
VNIQLLDQSSAIDEDWGSSKKDGQHILGNGSARWTWAHKTRLSACGLRVREDLGKKRIVVLVKSTAYEFARRQHVRQVYGSRGAVTRGPDSGTEAPRGVAMRTPRRYTAWQAFDLFPNTSYRILAWPVKSWICSR